MLEGVAGWNAHRMDAQQIRKMPHDFCDAYEERDTRSTSSHPLKRRSIGQLDARRDEPRCGTAIASDGIEPEDKRSRLARPLMFDLILERVSYDPMAIFVAVAIVLLVLLARTL